ncbi:MAG: penicillin-binding protein 2 [Armatimonadota bacterium]|nr:penicillin-binding protein 2 [bacterium]
MASRSEDRKLQLARINAFAIVVSVLFLILLARLWYLQVALGDELMQASESNRIKLLRARAPRGTLLDRKGRVIATSRPQFVVLAVPDVLNEHERAMRILCDILKITPDELSDRLETSVRKGESRPGAPVRVEVDVPLMTVARIGELRMELPGVSVELDNLRNYPDGQAVAHVVGYLGEISEERLAEAEKEGKNDYRPGDYVGKSGLEREYEDLLRGTDGGKQIEVNAMGRVVRILGEKRSVPGKTLKLTLDRDLQVAAERSLGNQTGAVAAIDVNTGKVLAMVSKPSYDPNIFVKRIKRSDWDKITRERALQNRSVYNVYPPGSTFKPIMAIAGLVYNVCNEHTTVSCPGSFYFGRHRFGCWKVHGGGVTFKRAIAESCDVWFYRLSLRLGIDRMARVAKQFGIGQATGIDLPYESRYDDNHVGTMPSTQWKKKRFKSTPSQQKWYPGETPSCGIGQGYVETSPLQMALAIAAVANKGKVYKPYLLDEVLDRNGKIISRTKPIVMHQVDASPENFEMVRQAMRATVTEGTGRVCNIPGITVAGKTGSAENRGAAHAWFVCFAPVEKPRIAIACIVEHGRHGATAAAPVCRAIMDVYFGKKKVGEIGQKKVFVSGD